MSLLFNKAVSAFVTCLYKEQKCRMFNFMDAVTVPVTLGKRKKVCLFSVVSLSLAWKRWNRYMIFIHLNTGFLSQLSSFLLPFFPLHPKRLTVCQAHKDGVNLPYLALLTFSHNLKFQLLPHPAWHCMISSACSLNNRVTEYSLDRLLSQF